MPKPRKALISLDDTTYYHCMSRCVRRAFLCGDDPLTGQSYGHRRQWILDKLIELTGCFAIDCCGYALMSNHYHLVLFVDRDTAKAWTQDEVIERWQMLFKGSVLVGRYRSGQKLSRAEQEALNLQVSLWRERLMDISWFMRCLNESVARRANQEDQCSGRFWEGRFKSQALLDEKALAACLVYVDLNPVRANMAETPESSDYTSIADRFASARGSEQSQESDKPQPAHLLPFVGNPRHDMPKGLSFNLTDYLELVDWTGRIIREGKPGYIPQDLPPILDRLQFDPQHWCYLAKHFESPFKGLVGAAYALKQACQTLGYQRSPGMSACRQFLT
jgi:REP element-mobilizing transposase RayT